MCENEIFWGDFSNTMDRRCYQQKKKPQHAGALRSVINSLRRTTAGGGRAKNTSWTSFSRHTRTKLGLGCRGRAFYLGLLSELSVLETASSNVLPDGRVVNVWFPLHSLLENDWTGEKHRHHQEGPKWELLLQLLALLHLLFSFSSHGEAERES